MPDQETSENKALTPRQHAFCLHYAATLNGARAARLAGYSAARAKITAFELRGLPQIREEINRLLRERNASAEEALAVLSAQLEADIGELYDEKGEILSPAKMREAGVSRFVKRLGRNKYGVQIQMHDAGAAAVHILKAAGRYGEELEAEDENDVLILPARESDANSPEAE